MVEGMSIREASREFGLHRDTVRKMLAYSVPPGYRRQTPASLTGSWMMISGSRGSRATRPSASSSGCETSTGSAASTP